MWSLILGLLKDNWRGTVIACLTLALALSLTHSKNLTVEYQDKETKWKIQMAMAQQLEAAQREQYKQSVEKINADHEALLAQAKTNAAKNIDAAIKVALASRGPRTNSMRFAAAPPATASSDAGSGSLDEGLSDPVAHLTRSLADQCATTTELYNEWRELCRLNNCEVKE